MMSIVLQIRSSNAYTLEDFPVKSLKYIYILLSRQLQASKFILKSMTTIEKYIIYILKRVSEKLSHAVQKFDLRFWRR